MHVAGESHLVRTPLSQLEQDWAGAGFVRVHRSFIINLAALQGLEKTDSDAYTAGAEPV